MSPSPPGDSKDLPFDLPLDPPGTQPDLPLDSPSVPSADGVGASPEPLDDAAAANEEQPNSPPGIYGRRWMAAVLDLGVHLAVLLAAAAGSWWLGVTPDRTAFLPLLVFLACFSFVYHVVPLTFWGHTPGMAGVGLVARDLNGNPLTIHQAAQRWLGSILNVASLGTIFLISRRRSLPDLISGSAVGEHTA